MYYVYMIRCLDESIYTGYTNNLERRYQEHLRGKSCKYTGTKGVKKLETYFTFETSTEARKVENFIKKQSKTKKEKIVQDPLKFENDIRNKFS